MARRGITPEQIKVAQDAWHAAATDPAQAHKFTPKERADAFLKGIKDDA